MNILIVEDNLSRWERLAQFLTSAYYSLRLAQNSTEAFAYSSEADLIIVDAEIASEGVSLCKELRCRGYTRPLILMALDSLDDVLISGADEWLEVPLHKQEVLLKVKLLLTRYYMWTSNTMPAWSQGFCEYDPNK
ncbi:MAG: response regulator [Xenococcaceae cyanobacterium MO_188.B19]|nr:response regulator [Xenococcaceae cyanobacterium MO_188.B19]